MNKLNTFSNFSGLKPNKIKCEIAGIGVPNEVQVVLCGLKCVNFNNEIVSTVHFSYNKNLEQDENFCQHIVKIENILKLWRMRQSFLGRIKVFKSFINY